MRALQQLPEPDNPRFESEVTKWIQGPVHVAGDEIVNALMRIVREGPTGLSFRAFYALHVRYRRLKEHTRLRVLVDDFASRFADQPILPHLRSLAAKQNRGNLPLALDLARDAMRRMPAHPGVLHNFAETVAELQEAEVDPRTDHLRDAVDLVDRAIALSWEANDEVYAKYFATKARLLALLDRHSEAVEMLERAIDLEDPREADYAIRIGEYQHIREKILFRQYLSGVRARYDAMQRQASEELQHLRGNMVELIGLLAAVVAFLVGGSQVVKSDAALRLMVALAGAVLITYGGFAAVFHNTPPWKRITFVLSLGLALLGVAFFSEAGMLARGRLGQG